MTPAPGKPHFVYCRPHSKTITPQMQFVVLSSRGVNLGDRVIPEGEEFPADAVSEYALRCLYEQLKIELMPAEHPKYRGRVQKPMQQSPAKADLRKRPQEATKPVTA